MWVLPKIINGFKINRNLSYADQYLFCQNNTIEPKLANKLFLTLQIRQCETRLCDAIEFNQISQLAPAGMC